VADVSVIAPRAGEVIGDAPDRRVEILADHASLNATWSRFGPGRDGADLHVHDGHTDLFYVLEGELTLRLGPEGEEVPLAAGMLIRVPPGVIHGFRNASDAEVRYLNFHAPGMGFADYLRDLRDGREAQYDQYDPPEDGGRPVAEVEVGDSADVEAIRIFAASSSEPQEHRDARHTEIYVLEGELTVNGEPAATGAWVHVEPGEPHRLEGSARYLVVHTPA
jgi:quercetin dioxygenase-like cupin family protein